MGELLKRSVLKGTAVYFVCSIVLSLLVDMVGGVNSSAGVNQFEYLGCLASLLDGTAQA